MDHVFKAKGVTSEMTAEEAEAEAAVSPFTQLQRPAVVYVCTPGDDGDGATKLEEVVFKSEKIGLAAKAFRMVKISPDQLEKDPVLSGEGKSTPRLLILDPVKEKVLILEKGKLKAGRLYKSMKSVAGRFYEENLEKVVKAHLRLLTEQDRIVKEIETLRAKETRLSDGGKKVAGKLKKVREEIAEVQDELTEVEKAQDELWKMTPKHEESESA